jgi:hypothetical protein
MAPIKFSDTKMLFLFWIGDKNKNPVDYNEIKDIIKITSYNLKIDY